FDGVHFFGGISKPDVRADKGAVLGIDRLAIDGVGFDGLFPLAEDIVEVIILPKIQSARSEPVAFGRAFALLLGSDRRVGRCEFNADPNANEVAAILVILPGLLCAIARGILMGELDNLCVRSKQLDQNTAGYSAQQAWKDYRIA